MWVLAMFDLPTDTKQARRRYTQFRKHLLEDGFTMMQYSVYIRHCASKENAQAHVRRVEREVPPDGEVRSTFGERGAGSGQLSAPFGVCVLRSGGILVVDEGAHRVSVFDTGGRLEREWGGQGLGASEFFKPKGAVELRDGRVVVIDYGNHRGQIFRPGGDFVDAFGARLFVKETRPTQRRPARRND